jgi:hypothetical protein
MSKENTKLGVTFEIERNIPNCPFCGVPGVEVPSNIVLESDYVVACINKECAIRPFGPASAWNIRYEKSTTKHITGTIW